MSCWLSLLKHFETHFFDQGVSVLHPLSLSSFTLAVVQFVRVCVSLVKICTHRTPSSFSPLQGFSSRSTRTRGSRRCSSQSCWWPLEWCSATASSGCLSTGMMCVCCWHLRWTMAPCRTFISGSGITSAPVGVLFKLLSHLSRSGYDFGYLIKILSNANLPEEEVDFFEILRLYFPVIYDVKYLMKSCKSLKVTQFLQSTDFLRLCSCPFTWNAT